MRLDKYLKVSRIIKRRTVANDACDGEHVTVNGRVARASYEVKPGDIIEIGFGRRILKVRVLKIAETVGKGDAGELYEIVSQETAEREKENGDER
ncbi:MAG: RNA-binding S4 domain-containing protein [Clostridia bacterium]|nr:RNA-binding S4 domain-containing protein [Clostridia bacterium]